MKRILCLICAVMLLGITAFAVDSAACTIYAASVTAAAGETVDVTVSITGNPGCTNYAVLLDYDREKLTLQSITPAESAFLTAASAAYKAADGKSYGFVSAAAETEQSADGALFTATFLVSEGFSGSAAVTPIVQYVRNNTANYAVFAELSASSAAGSVSTGVLGDVNGDGKINALDAALTYRYVNNTLAAAQLGNLNTYAMDVSGDGRINALDAAMIYRYSNNTLTAFPAAR